MQALHVAEYITSRVEAIMRRKDALFFFLSFCNNLPQIANNVIDHVQYRERTEYIFNLFVKFLFSHATRENLTTFVYSFYANLQKR